MRKDGTVVPVSIAAAPIRSEDGIVVGASCVHRDMTELKQALDYAQSLIDSAPDAMLGVDQAGVIQFVNHQTERLFGYDGPDHRASYVADPVFRPLGTGLALFGRRQDGTTFPADITLSNIQTKDGMLTTAAVRDITPLKKALELTERMAAIVEGSEDAIMSSTLDGIITSWNPAAQRMFGYSGEEIVGKHIDLLIPPDRAAEMISILARISSNGTVESFATTRIRRDGTLHGLADHFADPRRE
jgi:PAS domain S-box-containing protein